MEATNSTTAEPLATTELLTTAELMARLKVSEITIYTWRKAKTIPFIKIGRQFRYRLPEVLEALQAAQK